MQLFGAQVFATPYLVQTYSLFDRGPITWFELELVEGPTLAERIARPDPQFDRIAHSSRETSAAVAFIAAGNSTKASPSPTSDFMRAAIPLAGGSDQTLVMALLDMNRGFQWVLAPQESIPPGKTQAQPGQPAEPEAPSLRKRGPRPN